MHLAASPVLTADDAAVRLHEVLPRGARVAGALWMLPFCRVSARGPVGVTRVDILAASLGDPRLHNVRLPDVDLMPFGEVALPEHRLLPRTADDALIRARARTVKFEAESIDRLIHYPFWRISIAAAGRRSAAWVDAVEGSITVHDLSATAAGPSKTNGVALIAMASAAMAAAEIGLGGATAAVTAAIAAVGLAGGLTLVLAGGVRAGRPVAPPGRRA